MHNLSDPGLIDSTGRTDLDSSPMRLAVRNHLGKDVSGSIGLPFSDTSIKNPDELMHLLFRQSRIHGGPHVKNELSFGAAHVCEGGNGRQFPFLTGQHVADKDIRKQMLLEKGIHNRPPAALRATR